MSQPAFAMNRFTKLAFFQEAANAAKHSRGLFRNEIARSPIEFQYICRRNPVNAQPRFFSSSFVKNDERLMEEDAERKIGWVLKTLFFGTAGLVGYNLFPYMGENLMQQSVSLLHVKDPLFKRIGASRLTRFAIDDERRLKIVEMGGAEALVSMLVGAKDDRTRMAALKALVAISKSDDAARALHEAGAITVIRSTPDSTDPEYNEIAKCKSDLQARFLGFKI